MTQPLPWNFEPCENEGPICDEQGNPWPHAVRGRKPAGRLVTGYGYTEPTAWKDAEQKAQQYDAREMTGQRGESIPPQEPAHKTTTIIGYGTIAVMDLSS